jgi:hypothetical protein
VALVAAVHQAAVVVLVVSIQLPEFLYLLQATTLLLEQVELVVITTMGLALTMVLKALIVLLIPLLAQAAVVVLLKELPQAAAEMVDPAAVALEAHLL